MQQGEKIIEANHVKIDTIEDLKKVVAVAKGEPFFLKIEDTQGSLREEMVYPIHDASNSYKLGLWVKDAATGVGTLSFYLPDTKRFACLGHGIVDVDTSTLIDIENGNLTTTNLISLQKGTPR